MKQKKVLYLSHWYPSASRPNSGVFVKNHAKCISNICDLSVLSIEIIPGNKLYECQFKSGFEDGIKTYRIELKSFFYKLFFYVLFFQRHLIKKILKKNQITIQNFDLIHSNILFPSGVIAYKLAKKNKKPLVHTEHWSKLNQFLTKNIYRKSGLKALAYASKITAVSEFLNKEIARYTDSKKLVVVPNVIDDSLFTFKEKEKSDQALIFLAVANWEKPKNPFYFLDALESIQHDKRILTFELNLVGEGSIVNEIKQKNYSFKINYLGFASAAELALHFQQSDFFLHGSDYETFSVVIVEVLSTGTPVLVSDVGIAQEVIHERNGFICKNDPEDWKRKIILAFGKNYNHREIASELKEKYNQNHIAQLFDDIYEQVI